MQTSIFLQEDSLANHSPQPDSEEAQKMTATSGLKCLESFEKLNPGGSWEKMFSGLLIGMKGWCSTRCYLTWKLKGTPHNRFYFQLAPLTPRTEETESGLLPTPDTQNHRDGTNLRQITKLEDTFPQIAKTAREAIEMILKEPVVTLYN